MHKKLTPADVAANIRSEFYFTAAEGVLGASKGGTRPVGSALHLERITLCVLVLQSGFTVVGEAYCADPAEFNRAAGEKFARDNALEKVWPLMAYALREQANEPQPE